MSCLVSSRSPPRPHRLSVVILCNKDFTKCLLFIFITYVLLLISSIKKVNKFFSLFIRCRRRTQDDKLPLEKEILKSENRCRIANFDVFTTTM